MQFVGTHHIAIKTSNFAAMRSFYEGTLGLTYLGGFPGRNVIFLGAGNATVELIEAGPPPSGIAGAIEQVGRKIRRRLDRGWHHLALEVADTDAAHRELAAKGVAFHVPPESFPKDRPLARLAFFTDPDGNEIELYQPVGERYPRQ